MKALTFTALFAVSSLTYANDNLASLIGFAQNATSGTNVKTLVSGFVPGYSDGAVYKGGVLISGNPPMSVLCVFQQPNACKDADGVVTPFYKYIIKQTGETSFIINRIEITNRSNTEHLANIYFTVTHE